MDPEIVSRKGIREREGLMVEALQMSWATAAIMLFSSPSLFPVDSHKKMTVIFVYVSLLIKNEPNLVYIIIRGPLATALLILCRHFGDFARGPCWAMGYVFILWVTFPKPPLFGVGELDWKTAWDPAS